ncbi:MAG: DUF2207 family protein [Acidimicrobiia bacterium]
MPGLVAATTSDGFSLPALIAAGAVAALWVAAAAAVWVARRPPHVDGAPPTMELGPEPPAIAGLLCNDYEVRAETAPATLVDLAARDVIALEEVQQGQTICRVPPEESAGLAPFEQHVLTALRSKAVDGVIPATALTTGTQDASASWHRRLSALVVTDAKQRGLTVDRWPRAAIGLIGAGVLVVIALVLLSAQIGGDAEDHPVAAGIAGATAIGGAMLLGTVAGRMKRSSAQRPTPEGSATEARWLGVRAHLAQNEHLQELPPTAVKIYGRHLAYAAQFGLADHAVTALPFGEEDDHLAWSPQGGRWRRVRVRYPRVRPPGWGRHPALATALGLFWGIGSIYLLVQLTSRVGNGAVLLAAFLAVPLLWSIWVLTEAVPDLFTTRTITGTVLRCRVRTQLLSNNQSPRYWYYVAIDDGSRDRIAAFRVPEDRYVSVRQGQRVTADVAPRLGYVRELR